MKHYEDEQFTDWRQAYDFPWQRSHVYQGFTFTRCKFAGCALSFNSTPTRRTIVRDVTLEQCQVADIMAQSPIFERCTVRDLSCITTTAFLIWGASLNQVTIEGKVTNIPLKGRVQDGRITRRLEEEWLEADRDFYSRVEWALDISRVKAAMIELKSVPGHLIRRDRTTQALITREEALRGRWKTVDTEQQWHHQIKWCLDDAPWESFVLAAPIRSKHFQKSLDALHRLRDAGIVDMA